MGKRKGLLVTMICASAIGLISFAGPILRSGGFFTLSADFNYQQLPFTAAAWDAVHEGKSWLWGVDLGASAVTTFSFYNLGSPFFWATLLFSKDSFPGLVGFMFVLKYIVASGTGYTYLSRFVKPGTAVVGALLYAFSGFQATNLVFYHFHDAVAFFPLLLTGLEDYLQEKNRSGFIFAVFLNCLVNYFFFIQEVIFLILYFLFRVYKQYSLRQTGKSALGCIMCGLLGVCMAGVLFFPSILYVLGNERSTVQINSSGWLFSREKLLHIIKGMLLPADTMDSLTAIFQTEFSSNSCYLPLFGITCALAYALRKRDWLGKLLLLLTGLALFPFGNGLFLLFTGVYCRWWYMWTMMMALATARVLEAPKAYPVRMAGFIQLGLQIALYLAVRSLVMNPEIEFFVYDESRWKVLHLLSGAGIIFLMLPLREGIRKPLTFALACIFCTGTTTMTLNAYRDHEEAPQEIRKTYLLGLQLETPDEQYRFATFENLPMITGDTGGYGSFVSTVENESHRFNRLMDCYYAVNTGFRFKIPYLSQLLGAKYQISRNQTDDVVVSSFQTEDVTWHITEREACPIGFAVDRWITEADLLDTPSERRAVLLMNAAVAEKALQVQIEKTGIPRLSGEEAAQLEAESSIRRTKASAVLSFQRNNDGFSCKTAWDQDRLVYFTVPYDNGWTVKLDQHRTEVFNAGGMMALPVTAGEHELVFTYHTPGFTAGIMISALSFVAFGMLTILSRRRHRTQPVMENGFREDLTETLRIRSNPEEENHGDNS